MSIPLDEPTADRWSLVILIAAPLVAYVIARAFGLSVRSTLVLGVMLAAAGGFIIDGLLLHPYDLPSTLVLGALQVPFSAVAAFLVSRVRARSDRERHQEEALNEEDALAPAVSRCPSCHWLSHNGNVVTCPRCGTALVSVD